MMFFGECGSFLQIATAERALTLVEREAPPLKLKALLLLGDKDHIIPSVGIQGTFKRLYKITMQFLTLSLVRQSFVQSCYYHARVYQQ